MKTNPLNQIKIASPCSADWNEMRGDNRQRYCSECKLNVYNLSEMTQREAENLLFEKEGKMCVRLYKRSDGTVITQDCPVGLAKLKQNVSRFATATFGLIVGFFGGVWVFNQVSNVYKDELKKVTVESKEEISSEEKPEILLKPNELMEKKYEPIVGRVADSSIVSETKKKEIDFSFSGGISNGPELMWIFTERYPKK